MEHDDSVSGFAKMAKVVEIVAPKVPEIAAELADLPTAELPASDGADAVGQRAAGSGNDGRGAGG